MPLLCWDQVVECGVRYYFFAVPTHVMVCSILCWRPVIDGGCASHRWVQDQVR